MLGNHYYNHTLKQLVPQDASDLSNALCLCVNRAAEDARLRAIDAAEVAARAAEALRLREIIAAEMDARAAEALRLHEIISAEMDARAARAAEDASLHKMGINPSANEYGVGGLFGSLVTQKIIKDGFYSIEEEKIPPLVPVYENNYK